MDQTTRTVADSMVEQVYQVRPEHLNGAARLFGGQLMAWIDEVAGLVAIRHSKGEVVTASVDNLRFIRGARQHDLIVLIGRITYVGNTSMEVRVDTYAESLNGQRRLVNTAYLVEVAIDENGKGVEVPGLICETPEQKMEWEGGERRYKLRKQRKLEGF